MKPLFCNRCHKRIMPPKMLLQGNIVAAKPIKLGCGDKKCADKGGHALFVVPKKENIEQEQIATET